MRISQIRRENKEKTLYQRAAEECGVDYDYVCKIAAGSRKAVRGRALKVKQYLLEEINKNLQDAS